MKQLKLISWNVNGINACYKKGLLKFLKSEDADIVCLQETKGSPNTIDSAIINVDGYNQYWFRAKKKGYSGVLVFSKNKPLKVLKGIGDPETDHEGRVITLEFEKFCLINSYFVNSQRGLARLGLKQHFNNKFLEFCKKLEQDSGKPLIICGDFNVAHTEIDIARPKQNTNNAGFTQQERDWFTEFLKAGYIDTFRLFNNEGGHYTWWSYMSKARAKDIGWRIDYFVVSESLKENVINSEILKDVYGSDHCPIRLKIKI